MLGLEREFVPALAEQEHPRPEKLYQESPVMYNYVLAAYRLGDCIGDYKYTSEQHRHKWMPWKKVLEEWLEVPMSRGTFTLHRISDGVRLSGSEKSQYSSTAQKTVNEEKE